jgi:hypothetical protein
MVENIKDLSFIKGSKCYTSITTKEDDKPSFRVLEEETRVYQVDGIDHELIDKLYQEILAWEEEHKNDD